MRRQMMIDLWIGPRPDRSSWRPRKREPELPPEADQKRAFRAEAERHKEEVLVSGFIFGSVDQGSSRMGKMAWKRRRVSRHGRKDFRQSATHCLERW